MRTLIVDDSETVRDGLSRLLESKPYCELVGAVSDPGDALEQTRTMHPHVVLQDYSMPGVDAIQLVRELSACRPQPAVLMLSAFADAPSARQAVEAGAIGWVLKDAEPEQLFAALLGAAGFRDSSHVAATSSGERQSRPTAVPPPPRQGRAPATGGVADWEVATPLDARTVWAVLRALQGAAEGLTIDEVAARAVLSNAVAVRYMQRITARNPPLAVPVGVGGPLRIAITNAGRLELARLEDRLPEAHAGASATLLR